VCSSGPAGTPAGREQSTSPVESHPLLGGFGIVHSKSTSALISAENTLEKLRRHFGTWFDEPLTTITIERLESWKIHRLNAGRKAITVLRDLFTLSSVLSRATKLGLLPENPIRRVDKPRFDRRPNVRFLDDGAVRDLLGHSSIAMSLRYAHLAPDQRREAVAMLNQRPILALTVRLPSNAEVERPSVTF
jgi:site-specific recombinase XerD